MKQLAALRLQALFPEGNDRGEVTLTKWRQEAFTR
jgi:hypothetical protein